MIQLPNNKKCYNLPEQVAQNLLNIQYLAEQYKNIDELPSIWQSYKETFDAEQETFGDWTTTFEGWDNTLSTYLANMSSAAVGAIAGQDIAPRTVSQTNPNYSTTYSGSSSDIGTLTQIYNRVEVINNVLYFILNIKATATAGTCYVGGQACAPSLTISNAIAEKIIDVDGDNARESKATVITAVPCVIMKGKTYNSPRYKATLVIVNSSWEGGINAYVIFEEQFTKDEGADYYIMARAALTML